MAPAVEKGLQGRGRPWNQRAKRDVPAIAVGKIVASATDLAWRLSRVFQPCSIGLHLLGRRKYRLHYALPGRVPGMLTLHRVAGPLTKSLPQAWVSDQSLQGRREFCRVSW